LNCIRHCLTKPNISTWWRSQGILINCVYTKVWLLLVIMFSQTMSAKQMDFILLSEKHYYFFKYNFDFICLSCHFNVMLGYRYWNKENNTVLVYIIINSKPEYKIQRFVSWKRLKTFPVSFFFIIKSGRYGIFLRYNPYDYTTATLANLSRPT
jgi:hypothetical protein